MFSKLSYLISTLLLTHDGCGCASKPRHRSCAHNQACGGARAGVVSNSPLSAGVGRDVLNKGGSAVDAAIATLFCEGVMLPHAMGIGGGFLMTLYDARNKVVKTLNAREAAPFAANENMFEGQIELSEKGKFSFCVPGEVSGCWHAHKEYGKLPWSDLVKPSSIFAKYGFRVTPFMESIFAAEEDQIRADDELKNLYINPKTDKPYKAEEIVKNVKLGLTLEKIAQHGESVLYDGEMTCDFVGDIKRKQGILTVEDMKQYKPIWECPLRSTLPNCHTLYSVNTPGSGAILILILNILESCLDMRYLDTTENWHKIIETFKFAYGAKSILSNDTSEDSVKTLIENLTSKLYATNMKERITEMTHQDPEYYGACTKLSVDHGTANIVVMAAEGDAVVVTSSINQNFGAGIVSESTGIILNDQMSSFSIPNDCDEYGFAPTANFPGPGVRPASSMAPSIILDKCKNVVLGIGGSGGPIISAEVALVILRHIFYNEPLGKAMSSRRLLHQLFPMHIKTEYGFCEPILRGLIKRGHQLDIKVPAGFEAVTAMARNKTAVCGCFDPRRGGQVSLTH
ncbi:hypothetical protein FQR65_LT09247 [Abscondita terminalis]|nr:hypothetical protein FQR65_LT09247 [Abscondita terminalis]